MEPKFQTSFIPKGPVAAQANSVRTVHTTNLFSVFAALVFVLAVVAAGGLYLYANFLNGQITADDASLNSARTAFEPQTIQELLDANAQIQSAKTLLNNHVTVSQLLLLLQTLTVQRMQFTDLTFAAASANSSPTLTIDGQASSYNALAQAESIFSQSPGLQSAQFSNFGLSNTGTVTFSFSSGVTSDLISYKSLVNASSQ